MQLGFRKEWNQRHGCHQRGSPLCLHFNSSLHVFLTPCPCFPCSPVHLVEGTATSNTWVYMLGILLCSPNPYSWGRMMIGSAWGLAEDPRVSATLRKLPLEAWGWAWSWTLSCREGKLTLWNSRTNPISPRGRGMDKKIYGLLHSCGIFALQSRRVCPTADSNFSQ